MIFTLMNKRIAVIGAGIGGLSAAIKLASIGYRVSIFEKLNRPGGKMGELRDGGFRWDIGPSVITMRDVFETLFAQAGRRLEDYVELAPLEPITRYFWCDGLVLDAVSDEAQMRKTIAQFSPIDADGYSKYLRHISRLYETIKQPFLYRKKPTARDLLSLPIHDALRIDAYRVMHRANTKHFHDPRLVQLFDRFATYNGSSPYRAPATLNVIAHVEMSGAWYPRGGVFELAKAFEKLAVELGVEIFYNANVEEIIIKNDTAKGIRFADGSTSDADAVICNVDVTFARSHLLAAPRGSRTTFLASRLEPSCSGFVLLLGVNGRHNALAHHNIFFSDDYAREFDDIFTRRQPPNDPTLYVCITSKTDADHAPQHCENWFVMSNAPYLSEAFDWTNQTHDYACRIKQILAERAGLDESQIVYEKIITPLDLQNMYNGNRGAIYGWSSNSRMSAFMRPNNRDDKIKRLYFAGGSTHPGGGVPLVALSGMAAASCLIEDDAASVRPKGRQNL
jgi:phytoene desaturase